MLMSFVEGESVGPRVLRSPSADGSRSPADPARRSAGPDPRDRSRGHGSTGAGGHPRSSSSSTGSRSSTGSASPCRSSSWAYGGCARTGRPRRATARPRRLPARQFHRRRERAGRRDRLGARAPRRSRRGHRLALHPLLAFRPRRSPGGRSRGARSLRRRLRGGRRDAPDRERIRYWEVFGNVKWAVICARQANDHLTGLRRSHELASLGRRICEPEWDLLELIREALRDPGPAGSGRTARGGRRVPVREVRTRYRASSASRSSSRQTSAPSSPARSARARARCSRTCSELFAGAAGRTSADCGRELARRLARGRLRRPHGGAQGAATQTTSAASSRSPGPGTPTSPAAGSRA